jgi:hypothetical protein
MFILKIIQLLTVLNTVYIYIPLFIKWNYKYMTIY